MRGVRRHWLAHSPSPVIWDSLSSTAAEMHHEIGTNISIDSNARTRSIEDLHRCILQRSCTRNYQNRKENVYNSYKKAARESTYLRCAWQPGHESCPPTLPAGTMYSNITWQSRDNTYSLGSWSSIENESSSAGDNPKCESMLWIKSPQSRNTPPSHNTPVTHNTWITLEMSFWASS